ncbi:uncharacterized protein DUF222, partial [Nocardioides sp. J9]|uniref:DUF222 domain-containing protein n=1 Tax=Nocardioides sp. J9 TaxID=935844 RepID=UPI0011A3338F
MVTDRAVAEMTAREVLDFVEDRNAARLQAERDILRAAYQWAILHNPDTLPPHDQRGRDRARPAGAEDTPRITEYAAAAFGARIQTSPFGAKRLIADAVDLHHRLPKLQAGIDTGTIRVRQARHVAEATRDLTADEAAWVDDEIHEVADGRLPWARFETLVEAKVAAAAPELARAKEEAAEKDRFVRMSRVNRHGIATLTIRDHATTILAADAALNAVARQLEEAMPDVSKPERKLAAFALL